MIMEQTKSMDPRALERIRKVFADYWGGRLFCPGWYLDVKRIERERGITFDGNICQARLPERRLLAMGSAHLQER
jgi:hypothetical protein